jgi:hypothetical protein
MLAEEDEAWPKKMEDDLKEVWQEKAEEDLKKEKNRTEQLLEETGRKQQNPKDVMYSDVKVWFAFAQ